MIEARRVEAQGRPLPVQILRHGEDIGLDDLPVLLQVGFRHRHGLADGRAHPFAEPALQSEIEHDDREDGDDYGRCDGQQTEQPDQPGMQARAGGTPLPGHPDIDQMAADQSAQRQQQHQVEIEQQQDIPGADRHREVAGHRAEGRHSRRHRRNRQGDGQIALQAYPARPEEEAQYGAARQARRRIRSGRVVDHLARS